MEKLNYLNVGCGDKFHKAWTNIDMHSTSPDVLACNLLNGFPFENDSFEVVYHSQVLEHFPKEKASYFLSECFRVLKPGGVLRVVAPDLENIAKEYLKWLSENLTNPNPFAEANYDWIMLEMYDQTVRNYSGGQMAEFLSQPKLANEQYVIDRIGHVGKNIIEICQTQREDVAATAPAKTERSLLERLRQYVVSKFKEPGLAEAQKIGSFRLGGEIHMWMYDRFSLSRLLAQVGFENIKIASPYESDIRDWGSYELDVKDGAVFDPTSLFMEATKPKGAANI